MFMTSLIIIIIIGFKKKVRLSGGRGVSKVCCDEDISIIYLTKNIKKGGLGVRKNKLHHNMLLSTQVSSNFLL